MPIFMLQNIISAETKVPNSIRSLACKIYLEDDCILLMFIYKYLYTYSLNIFYKIFQNCSYGVELFKEQLTHWGQVTHICVGTHTDIGSDNGLSPGRRLAIIWTNDGILLIQTFWTHFSEIVSEIHTFSFKKIHFKMSSGKWRPSCVGLNVLRNN